MYGNISITIAEKDMPKSTKRSLFSRRQSARTKPESSSPSIAQTIAPGYRVREDIELPSGMEPMHEIVKVSTIYCHEFDQSRNVSKHHKTMETPDSVHDDTVGAYPHSEPIEIVGDGVKFIPLTEEEAKAALEEVPISYTDEDDEDYATYSIQEAAEALQTNIDKIVALVKEGKLVGLELDPSDWRIPVAQIRDGTVALGLEKIKDLFESSEDLWQYLVTEQFTKDGWIKPLEVHFRNDLKEALIMAEELDLEYL